MTGNDRVAFPDARGDLCTDPECYRAKVQAHAKALAAEKAGEGAKVLSGKAAEKVLGYNSGYLKLSEQCYDDQKYRSYKAILKTALSDGRLPLTVAINERNEVIELVDRGDAEQIMRKDKLIKKRPSMSFRSQPSASQVAARKFYQDLGKELMIAAANAGAGVMNGMDKGWSAAQATFFRQIVKTVIQITWRYGSELQIVLNARTEAELGRGIDAARMEDEKKALSELIDKLNAAQLMGLIAEVLACDLAPVDHHHRGYQDAERNELFASLGVDLEAIKARLQAEAKGKAKTSATGGRK
jgi:hypothetical protein